MTQGAVTTDSASSFPPPNLPPSAQAWARAAMQRIAQLEDQSAQHGAKALETNKTLIQTLRRTKPGAFVYRGDYAYSFASVSNYMGWARTTVDDTMQAGQSISSTGYLTDYNHEIQPSGIEYWHFGNVMDGGDLTGSYLPFVILPNRASSSDEVPWFEWTFTLNPVAGQLVLDIGMYTWFATAAQAGDVRVYLDGAVIYQPPVSDTALNYQTPYGPIVSLKNQGSDALAYITPGTHTFRVENATIADPGENGHGAFSFLGMNVLRQASGNAPTTYLTGDVVNYNADLWVATSEVTNKSVFNGGLSDIFAAHMPTPATEPGWDILGNSANNAFAGEYTP